MLAAEWLDRSVPRRAGIVTCKGYGAPVLERPRVTETYCGMKRVVEGFPGHRYLVTQEHPAFTLTGVRPDVLAYLRRRGGRRRRSSARSWQAPERGPYFYSADAFFVPFSGFGAVERGGPVLKVWDLERVRKGALETRHPERRHAPAQMSVWENGSVTSSRTPFTARSCRGRSPGRSGAAARPGRAGSPRGGGLRLDLRSRQGMHEGQESRVEHLAARRRGRRPGGARSRP